MEVCLLDLGPLEPGFVKVVLRFEVYVLQPQALLQTARVGVGFNANRRNTSFVQQIQIRRP